MTGYYFPPRRTSYPGFGREAADLPWWTALRERRRCDWRLADLDAAQVFGRDNLVAVFHHHLRYGGKAPGPDRVGYSDLGRQEVADIAGQLSDLVLSGGYRPDRYRPVRIPKAGGGTRELQIYNVADRWVWAAANLALAPAWDRRFRRRSHGFRQRRGCQTLLADLFAAITVEERWIVATDDIRDAFGHVRVARVVELFRRHVPDARLVDFVEAALLSNRSDAQCIGIAQGCALSPLALNIQLHHGFDAPWCAEPHNPPCWRYVDDLTFAGRSVPEIETALQRASSLLKTAGHQLHLPTGPVDLRAEQTVDLLGFRIRQQGQLRLTLTPDAWIRLEDHLLEAHEEPNPVPTARRALWGWIRAYGPGLGDHVDAVQAVRDVVARMGFAELASTDQIRGKAAYACKRWERLRRRAVSITRHRLRQLGARAPRGTCLATSSAEVADD